MTVLRSHRGEEFVEGGMFHRQLDREAPGTNAQFDCIPLLYVDLSRHGLRNAQGEAVAPFMNVRLRVSTMRLQKAGVKNEDGAWGKMEIGS